MDLQIKDYFIPNEGIGILSFYDDENAIISKLTAIWYEREDVVGEGYHTINLSYPILGVECFIHYEYLTFTYTSFHLKDLFILGKNISLMQLEDCISIIEQFHKNKKVDFIVDRKIDCNEEILFFESLGLTIWFEKNNVSDICIAPML